MGMGLVVGAKGPTNCLSCLGSDPFWGQKNIHIIHNKDVHNIHVESCTNIYICVCVMYVCNVM